MPAGQYKRGLSHEERFWSKVDKNGPLPEEQPELGNCWLWTGPRNGTSKLGFWKVEGKMIGASRSAFEVQHGPIPEGHNVFQVCRNKDCMRGDHLISGPKNSGPRDPRPTTPPDKGHYASEDWRDIDGFLGYEVSRFGEVRSWWIHGRSMYASKPKTLKPTPNTVSGYYYIVLTNVHGKTNALVHQLVLDAFVGPCPPGMEARHFPDRDKTNNKLENLSYSTHQENMDDRFTHGTVPRGDSHWTKKMPERIVRGDEHWARKHPERVLRGSAHFNARLDEEDYDQILKYLNEGYDQQTIAAWFGVSQERISAIKLGKRKR